MSVALAGEVLPILAAQTAAFEALLLATSAGHKLMRWVDSVGVMRGFAGVPTRLAPPALAAAVLIEASGCALLVLPGSLTRAVGAVSSAFIWATYPTLIVRAVLAGRRDLDCGCSFGSGRHALGSYQITRNIVLLGGAVAVAMDAATGATAPLQGSQLLAACALLALYGALDSVMGLRPLRSGETA